MSKKVVAVVGSYRRGGIIDTAVEAVLEGARERGASTQVIYLTEKHIEFCTNCRTCTQTPGPERGRCPQKDDLEDVLTQIEAADSLVLASPVNCGNVTAVFRRFMERMVGCAYWPWGQPAPKVRSTVRHQKAVLMASSAMPGLLLPIATSAPSALRMTARMLGARPIGKLWIGLAAGQLDEKPSRRKLERARKLGMRLA